MTSACEKSIQENYTKHGGFIHSAGCILLALMMNYFPLWKFTRFIIPCARTIIPNPITMNPSKQPAHRSLIIRAYSKKELAHLYEVSKMTMTRWLKPHLEKIGKREGHTYTVKQVAVIFEVLGIPASLDEAA